MRTLGTMLLNCCKIRVPITSCLFGNTRREMNSSDVETKCPCRCRLSLHYTHTPIQYGGAEFFFEATPGSPWAATRHHVEKGHTRAVAVLDRTDLKKPESRRQSGKDSAIAWWRQLQGWVFLEAHSHTSAISYIRGILSH
jgi:hypothetical protein